jgi:MerC mercury resistance protein
VHCVLTPWLAGLVPLLGPALVAERTETLFMTASLILSGATLSAGTRTHRQWWAMSVFGLGASLLAGVRVSGVAESAVGHSVVVCGAVLIIAGHLQNVRSCRGRQGYVVRSTRP